jgi:hypothetical protein
LIRSWFVLYIQNAIRFHSTASKIILFTTVRNVQPLLCRFSWHSLTIYGTNDMQISYVRFHPKSEYKCGYVRTAIKFTSGSGYVPRNQFSLNSQSFSDIMCAKPSYKISSKSVRKYGR